MNLAMSAHIKQIDHLAETKYNIPVETLMDNAGKSLCDAILNDINRDEYAIFCGKGNNGGDGLKLAKYLKSNGKKVSVYLTCDINDFSPVVKSAYDEALKEEVEFKELNVPVSENAVIVDALLGISLKDAPRGNIKDAIDKISKLSNLKVSVDIPSGLSADTGKVLGSVVKADYTYTLALDKVGLNVYPGIEYTGVKKVLDIGIPDECVCELVYKNYLTDKEMVASLIPMRNRNSHKGDFGKVGIVGGSYGMAGSVCLAALAALRTGAGLVYVFVPDDIFNTVSIKLTEAIVVKESELSSYLPKLDSIAIGMGYAQDIKKKHIIKMVARNFEKTVVFDAGSIGYLALNSGVLKNKKCSAILTPHTGEFSKLINMSTEEIISNRMFLTTKYAKEFNSVLLLKGAATLVGNWEGLLRINKTGNSGMATAGSGDVLSGIIAALLAMGMNSFDAATVGAYIHGLSGDIASENKTEYGMIASDIIEYIPDAYKKIFS